ncbi:MAG: hypothetical protein HY754_00135 [Nitrospirae bacterium]|nr:hypothetical protein [Nitrospirota bacterium]
MFARHFIRLIAFICVSCLCFFSSPSISSGEADNIARVDYEVSEGGMALIFTAIAQEDIVDILLDGESILGIVLNPVYSEFEYVDEGFIVCIGQRLPINGFATIEVLLRSSDRLVSISE